jgi:DNA-binding NarL/FixJ family response regulator
MVEQKRTRILIVENNAVVSSSLISFLNTHDDFEVVCTVETTCDAIDQCEQSCPHVVLMNLTTPGIGIVAAIHQLNQDFPDVRVVILSGFGLERMARAALAAGATHYLFKDVTGKQLTDAIRAAVSSRRTVWDNIQNHTYLDYCHAE